jgi:hypothetical protein
MNPRSIAARLAPLGVALILAACGEAVSDEYERGSEPYSLEAIEGEEELFRVVLSEAAVEHIGIETAPVEQRGVSLVVPYEAVYLDAHGAFWVYTNPEPLVYVRAPIEIVEETSTEAILGDGPPAGTLVVTVGAPELYGAEKEFGT